MEMWGLFVTKNELNNTIRLVKREGLDVFEVRKLTFIEKLTYIGNDVRLFFGSPYVVMFNATKEEYENFIHKHNFIGIF